jgi:uncharacterized membrane protein
MGSPGTAPAPASGGGLQDNVAGMLVYLVGILAIVFLVIEPYNKNKFVRFHCFQCLFYWGGVIVASIGLTIASFAIGMVPVVGGLIALVLWLALWGGMFVGWVMLMVKAYQGQMWKLPFIGELAAKQAGA